MNRIVNTPTQPQLNITLVGLDKNLLFIHRYTPPTTTHHQELNAMNIDAIVMWFEIWYADFTQVFI